MISRLHEADKSCPTYHDVFKAFKLAKHPTKLLDKHPVLQLLSVWNELSVVNVGLLCVDGRRIFVPSSCHKMILEKIHESHPGITRMYQTARMAWFKE